MLGFSPERRRNFWLKPIKVFGCSFHELKLVVIGAFLTIYLLCLHCREDFVDAVKVVVGIEFNHNVTHAVFANGDFYLCS